MTILKELRSYRDARGNQILFDGVISENVTINFRGSNNTLIVGSYKSFPFFSALFDCNNAVIQLGDSNSSTSFSAFIRVGQDASVRLGHNVSSAAMVNISAAEGTTVSIGDDVMLASENYIWSDDAHPIFGVATGKRINTSRSINIGSHVWLDRRTTVLGGANIGDGSVLRFGSVLKGTIPNNCMASGAPARITARNVAWERLQLPLLNDRLVKTSSPELRPVYWALTESPPMQSQESKQLFNRTHLSSLGIYIISLRSRAWHFRQKVMKRSKYRLVNNIRKKK